MASNLIHPGNDSQMFSEDIDRLKFVLNISGLGVWELQLATWEILWDDRCSELFGSAKGSTLAYEKAIQYIQVEDMQRVDDTVRNALKGENGGHFDIQFRAQGIPGQPIRWLKFSGQAFFDKDNKPLRYGGLAEDITELMTYSQNAEEATRLAQVALEASNAGSFRLLIESGRLEYSPILAKIITGDENKKLTRDDLISYIIPEDQPVREAAYAGTGGNGRLDYEVRTMWNDQSIHWMRTRGTYISNTDGKPVIFTGTVTDTTVERELQAKVENQAAAVAANESRLSHIVQVSPDIITRWDAALRLTYANRAFENQIGITVSNLLGKTCDEMGQPEDVANEFMSCLREVVQTGQPKDHFYEFPTPAGMTYLYARLMPEFAGDGTVHSVLSIARDVSEIRASEQRFRSLVEEAPVATCLFTGREMRIEIANEIMIGYWGKDSSVVGKPLAEALPELRGQPFIDILGEVYNTGKPFSSTAAEAYLNVKGKIGRYYFNFTYKPLFDTEGNVYGVIDMAVDVTEQVLAAQSLEEAEMHLQEAIDLAELGTWTLDVATNTLTVSERLEDWFGIEPGGDVLENFLFNIHDSDRERVGNAVHRAIQLQSDGIYNEEYRVTNPKTGKQKILHAQGKAQRDALGKAFKLNGTAQDITMQRELQLALEQQVQERTEELATINETLQSKNEELAESNKQLVHSNQELAQYAYVASHDLQEPLRKIRLFSGMLTKKDNLPEDIRTLLNKIFQSSERMSMLIRDLLDFSRLLKSDILVRPISLAEVTTAVVNDFELALEEKNGEVRIGALPTIQAVALQMNQLFYNLVSNALKFTRPGVDPLIEIDARIADPDEVNMHIRKPLTFAQYYHITIKDNGIGFEAKYSEHIFEVFKRLHGREVYPGSGIGLALCRRIVANHHGILFAESMPGNGSLFHLFLPDRQQDHESVLPNGFHWTND